MFYVGAVGRKGKLSRRIFADEPGGESVLLRHKALGVRQKTGEWARCLLKRAGLARAESALTGRAYK